MARGRVAGPPALDATSISAGVRAGIAVGGFLLAVVVSWAANRYVHPLPDAVMGAWYAGAAAASLVFAVTTPWRNAPALALAAGLVFGGLTYSPPARDHAVAALVSGGQWLGGLLHRGGGG